MNAEFQSIARRNKKTFLSDKCKEIEENNRIGKTRYLFRKLEIPREHFMEVQFSSVTQLCPTLCDPMNHSTPGLHVHHQLLEFTQTHVH